MLEIRIAAAEAAKLSRFTVGAVIETKFGAAVIKNIHKKGKELEATWPGSTDPHVVYRIAAKQVWLPSEKPDRYDRHAAHLTEHEAKAKSRR